MTARTWKELSILKKLVLTMSLCLGLSSAYLMFSGPPHNEFYTDFFENPGLYKSGGIYWDINFNEKIKDIREEDNIALSKCISSLNRELPHHGYDGEIEPYKIYYKAISEKLTYAFHIEMFPKPKKGWLRAERRRVSSPEGSPYERPRVLTSLGGDCLYDFIHSRHQIRAGKH